MVSVIISGAFGLLLTVFWPYIWFEK